VSTSSTSLCLRAVSKRRGTLHPVAFSTPSLCSPSPCLLHLIIFSTSSSSSPLRRRVFNVVVVPHSLAFSTSPSFPRRWCSVSSPIVAMGFSALSSNRRRRVVLRMARIPGLEYSMATAQRTGREGCSPAALDAIAVFALWVTTPALYFPRRSLCGTLCRRRISSLLFAVVLVGCPLRQDRVAFIIAGVVG
jgi:hypothetical protein